MKKRLGISSLAADAAKKQDFDKAASQLSLTQLDQLSSQLLIFKSSLEEFANKHRQKLLKDPAFRGWTFISEIT